MCMYVYIYVYVYACVYIGSVYLAWLQAKEALVIFTAGREKERGVGVGVCGLEGVVSWLELAVHILAAADSTYTSTSTSTSTSASSDGVVRGKDGGEGRSSSRRGVALKVDSCMLYILL